MAANGVDEDLESQYGGNKVQPFATPTIKELNMIEEEDQKKATSKTWRERVALEELFSLKVWRASISEVLGTGILVFMIDTIVISTLESETKVPNLIMAIPLGLIIAILVRTGMPISGGHINPIVTFAAALVDHISFSRAVVYILAQCTGSILGALALKSVVSSTIAQTFSLGGCTLTVISPGPDGVPITVGLETAQALMLEIVCSFIFLYASIWFALDMKQRKILGEVVVCAIVGVVVGIIVFISTTVTTKRGYAGVGMNPARCLGPAIVRGGHLWDGHWVFWVGPTIACLAFYLFVKIIPK